MSILKETKISYLLLVVLASIVTSIYMFYDNNKFVKATEKSISSVVIITSYDNNIYPPAPISIGSGVIFSNDGYIVTNFHVVSKGRVVKVRMANGKEKVAKIIGFDINSDIAVLKISDDESLNPIKIADSTNIKTGDKVLAIGNPYGIGISVSSGIISATGRDYGNPYLELIQTDAAINPGNSGGALINEKGNLIGINTKIFSKTGAYQGLGFAIPSNTIAEITSEIIQYGKVRSAWIGNFRVTDVRVNLSNQSFNGLRVIEIDKFGPLYDSGVRSTDIIIEINGAPSSWTNLTESLKSLTFNDTIKLKILNANGQAREIVISSNEIEKFN
jgi:S1-C subfamily serine protease